MHETRIQAPVTATVQTDVCRCNDPLPVQRAERKGAAATVCMRCEQRIPPRLR
jgi:hypothetical protein